MAQWSEVINNRPEGVKYVDVSGNVYKEVKIASIKCLDVDFGSRCSTEGVRVDNSILLHLMNDPDDLLKLSQNVSDSSKAPLRSVQLRTRIK